MTRRARATGALVGMGVAVVLGPTPSEAQEDLETIQVMAYQAQAYLGPLLVAEDQGFLAERGIEIEIVDQPANVSGIQGLEATRSHLGYFTIPTLAQAVQAGSDAVFFCGNIRVYETSLVAAPDTDLPSAEDGASAEEVFAALAEVEDLRIGTQTPNGSGLQLFSQAAFEAYGVEGATYITTGVQAPVIGAALANGDVDVALVTPTQTQLMMANGDVKRLLYMRDEVESFRLYGSAIGGMREWVEANPDLANGYCEAIQEGLDFILDPANAEAVNPILAEAFGVDDAIVELLKEESYPEYTTDIPVDAYDATVQAYIDLGVLQAEPAIDYAATVVMPDRPVGDETTTVDTATADTATATTDG